MSNKLYMILVFVASLLLSAQANSLAISDVNFGLLPDATTQAAAAHLGNRNDTARRVNRIDGLFEGDRWRLLDRTNRDSNNFRDTTFELTADTGQRSGSWNLSWSGTDIPLYMDLVFVVKAGQNWGAYLVESVNVGGGLLAAFGSFEVTMAKQAQSSSTAATCFNLRASCRCASA